MIRVVRQACLELSVRGRSWKDQSVNHAIFASATTIAIMTLFVKLASTGKEMVVAHQFGRGDALDAFLIAFLLPQFAVNVISGSFTASVVPALTRSLERGGPDARKRLVSEGLLLVMLLLLGSVVLLKVVMPFALPILASGFAREKYLLTAHLYNSLLPVLVLSGLSVYGGAILNAGRAFALPAVAPMLTPVLIVLMLLHVAPGIQGMVWGTIAGAAIELLVLMIAVRRAGWLLLPRWHGLTAQTRATIHQYIPMMAGAFLMSGTGLVDQAMAASLVPGSVAALNYGNKALALVIGLGAGALGTAVLPYFSQQAAREDWAGARHTMHRYGLLIIIITVPLTLLAIFASEWIVRVLFQRGAFEVKDTKLVAMVQAVYLAQVPFYLLGTMGARFLSAAGKNHILLGISAFNLMTCIVGDFVLMHLFGVVGIAMASVFVYFASSAFIFLFVNRYSKGTT
jgi:putative peptidoglycan lipid II flippase